MDQWLALEEYKICEAKIEAAHRREWTAISLLSGSSLVALAGFANVSLPSGDWSHLAAVSSLSAVVVGLAASLHFLLRRSHFRVQVARQRQWELERSLGFNLQRLERLAASGEVQVGDLANLTPKVRDRHVYRVIPLLMTIPWLMWLTVSIFDTHRW